MIHPSAIVDAGAQLGEGTRVWHFQTVHHGLWDYDNPAAPNLLDITVNGTRVKALAQVTKQGYVYTFDRTNGKPIWPIDEKPVPVSDVPGEKASPTQPVPSKPAPFEYQGVARFFAFLSETNRQAALHQQPLPRWRRAEILDRAADLLWATGDYLTVDTTAIVGTPSEIGEEDVLRVRVPELGLEEVGEWI